MASVTVDLGGSDGDEYHEWGLHANVQWATTVSADWATTFSCQLVYRPSLMEAG